MLIHSPQEYCCLLDADVEFVRLARGVFFSKLLGHQDLLGPVPVGVSVTETPRNVERPNPFVRRPDRALRRKSGGVKRKLKP